MPNTASDCYLITEVTTATPQKLQLMLIDAAIREGRRAQKHRQDKETEQAGKCILRARKIINGILAGMDYEAKSELVGKVAGVYLFISNALTRAFIDNDENKLAEALQVLDVERETWRQVCEKLVLSPGSQTPPQSSHAPLAPHFFSNEETASAPPDGSFSLEA
ncbi:MAG: flagellar export chaperone FliS [Thermoguttaceae bacterium]|jgi:flagellar protein FliS